MRFIVVAKATRNSEAGVMPGEDAEIEIRQVYEAEDFAAELAPELREQERRVRAKATHAAEVKR